jgi:hypothetical protein
MEQKHIQHIQHVISKKRRRRDKQADEQEKSGEGSIITAA